MTPRTWLSLGASTFLAALVACGNVVDDNLFTPFPDGYTGGGAGRGGGGDTGTGAMNGVGDFPCTVADVLARECDSCHAANVPPILRSRADFLGPADSDPTRTMGEVSVDRMQASTMRMPPEGAPPADVTTFAEWVADGMPAGDCGSGAGGAGGDPYDTPEMCSSGNTWTDGSDGGDRMYPGQACNDCHATEKPEEIYTVAGTVYPTAHEPDDCLGVESNEAVIEVTDANGAVHTLSTNASGNFHTEANYPFPITVRVLADGKSLPMIAELERADGDCNSCHNQDGSDGAPGRIVRPF